MPAAPCLKGTEGCLAFPQAGALQPLDDFEARFAGAKFHKGMEVAFSNTRSGGLALRIAGKDVRMPTSFCHIGILWMRCVKT